MNKIISAQNKIFVQIEKKFYDTVTAPGGTQFYQETTFNPQEFSMLEATVVSPPPRCVLNRPDYFGFNEFPKKGDTVLIRYDVIYSFNDQPDRDTPLYKNLVRIGDQDYWRADILQAFAVKIETGWRMLNQYVMCDLVEQKRDIGEILILPEHLRTEIRRDKMRVRHINHPAIIPGAIIYCAPNAAQEYKIGQDQFYIIKQSHIQGIAM